MAFAGFFLRINNLEVSTLLGNGGKKKYNFSSHTEILSGLQAHFIFCQEVPVEPPLDEIRSMAQRVVEGEKLELVDVEFKPSKSRSLLRIFIDKTGGVTLEDCENVSRQMSSLLDVQDIVKSAYVLEVSSPGLDRPFKTDRDYERNIGRFVRVHFTDAEGLNQQATGTLIEVTDKDVVLRDENGENRISREVIRRAHQEVHMPARPGRNRKKHK